MGALAFTDEAEIFILDPKRWKLVHQGGHHNVYCDKRGHIWTGGGSTGLTKPPYFIKRVGKCDCARYA